MPAGTTGREKTTKKKRLSFLTIGEEMNNHSCDPFSCKVDSSHENLTSTYVFEQESEWQKMFDKITKVIDLWESWMI